MNSELTKKAAVAKEIFAAAAKDNDVIAVAFSGGVDSSLVLAFALEAAQAEHVTVCAVTARTKLHPVGEWEVAKQAAETAGAIFLATDVDELVEAGIDDNPLDRCYRCKRAVFSALKKRVQETFSPVKSIFFDGTNYDDINVYRPGLKAIKELEVSSPLAIAQLTKPEVRALAADYGLKAADKPSLPCLATRLPYGTKISYELLAKIDRAEQFIRQIGFYNLRLRLHGNIARIEVDEADLAKALNARKTIAAALKKEGFTYVTLDLEGFRSGSMDIDLDKD